jgi:hypothetical protein
MCGRQWVEQSTRRPIVAQQGILLLVDSAEWRANSVATSLTDGPCNVAMFVFGRQFQ